MDEPTHSKHPRVGSLSTCGQITQSFSDDPTCLLCIAGVFSQHNFQGGVARIIEENSVKAIQELEDKRFLDAVDAVIESSKP